MTTKQLIAKTPTVALRMLWAQGYFQEWRKSSEIADHLSEKHHHFSNADLGMALLRAKAFLLKRGKRGSYEYIQRYPYGEEVEDER